MPLELKVILPLTVWRLAFNWGDSGPYDVLIEDPH